MTSTAEQAAAIAADFAHLNGHPPAAEADPMAEFWDARPTLRHLRAFARARGVAPLAVLGSAMVRALTMVPARYVLPPLVGGVQPLNLYLALVGPSGIGKGASDRVTRDALRADYWRDPIARGPLYTCDAGSGEGVLAAYGRYDKETKGTELERECVLFMVPEVDHLTAVGSRTGSSLLPTLRKAWSGEALDPQWSAAEKRLRILELSYRLGLVVGVQPGRARALLEDADGGTPQRFLWLPVIDPDAPDPEDRPAEPDPMTLPTVAVPPSRTTVRVCEAAARQVQRAQVRKVRGEVAPDLDSHRYNTQLRVAAALAVLDGHLTIDGITDEDWSLACALMAVSDATRGEVEAELRRQSQAKVEAQAERQATVAVRADMSVEEARLHRTCEAIRRRLEQRPEWTGGELRRALPEHRKRLPEAIDRLARAGDVTVEEVVYRGQTGIKIMRKG
jgi:hypothetical protein